MSLKEVKTIAHIHRR